jgi:nitrogen fixation/metabolism regulation signal transduction histidine kinase
MIFKRFLLLLIARLVLTALGMGLMFWLWLRPGMHSATLLALALTIALAAELWRYVSRTNREVARFLDAIRYADYSQRFDYKKEGSGFDALGQKFTEIIERIRERSDDQESRLRRLRALVEHIPVPLMTLHSDDSITLQNNAARRLFGAEHVTSLRDLRKFGFSFAEAVDNAVPGVRQLVKFTVEGIDYHLTLAATEIVVASNRERLISLQDIQSELDATQAEAWEDLVRVLTHEIMNSITPVSSLAQTAAELVDDVVAKEARGDPMTDDLDDLRNAVSTVARRSDSLTQFVDSYRQISRLAPPEKKRVPIAGLFDEVMRLAAAECPRDNVEFDSEVTPQSLDVYADRDLLEPVLLNLLRNAWQATVLVEQPRVSLSARLNRRNNVVIEVSDNGPGVPEDVVKKVFVPFFTTKERGSGVGLALARQVMIAHGGFIRLGRNASGGATFSLTF